MDLFPIRNMRSASRKELLEIRADIETELEKYTSRSDLSSLEEEGVENLRSSHAFVSRRLTNSPAVLQGSGSVSDQSEDLTFGSNPKKREVETSDNYMTLRAEDGSPVYAVGKGQRLVDVPGNEPDANSSAFGELVRASLTGRTSGLAPELKSVLSEGTGTAGGYLVPSRLSSMVVDLARNESVLVDAGMITIPLDTDHMRIATVTEDPVFTGRTENQLIQDSKVTFGAINIVPRQLSCLIKTSMEVVEDAPNFPAMITRTIARAFASSIDKFGLFGDGDSHTPRGLTFDPNLATELVNHDESPYSMQMIGHLEVRKKNHLPLTAIYDPNLEYEMASEKDSNLRWQEPPQLVKDKQQLVTNHMPDDSMFVGDFSQFALGLRSGLKVDFTDVGAGAFERNQRVFRVLWRGDFICLDPTAIVRVKRDPNLPAE